MAASLSVAPMTPGLDGRVFAARVEDGLDLLVLQVLLGDDGRASVLALDPGAFADYLDSGVDAVVAHPERVLDHEGAYDPVADALDLLRRGVPADDDHLAGLASLAHASAAPSTPGSLAAKMASRSGLAVRMSSVTLRATL